VPTVVWLGIGRISGGDTKVYTMIYHLLPEAEPFSDVTGGAISRWVANVAKSCGDMVVCGLADETWGFPRERIIKVVDLHRLSALRAHPRRIPAWMQKTIITGVLRPLIRSVRAGDIVWVHNRPEFASVLSQPLTDGGARVVLHMHNSHLKAFDSRALRLDAVTPVFCSNFLAQEAACLGLAMKPGFVLHNGVDLERFSPSRRGAVGIVEIAFSGRLVPEKGAHVLVEAMGLLHRQCFDAHCTIIGAAGFGTNTTSDYAKQLHSRLPSNTTMAGYLAGSEYAARLRQADVFCCPSIWEEPFGVVIIEAMASGLPVVASSTGGIPEILQHGGGLLVEPSDPAVLASRLKVLITDARLRLRTRDEALCAVRQHFSWDVIRQHYSRITSEVTRWGSSEGSLLPKTLVSC